MHVVNCDLLPAHQLRKEDKREGEGIGAWQGALFSLPLPWLQLWVGLGKFAGSTSLLEASLCSCSISFSPASIDAQALLSRPEGITTQGDLTGPTCRIQIRCFNIPSQSDL